MWLEKKIGFANNFSCKRDTIFYEWGNCRDCHGWLVCALMAVCVVLP